MDLQQTLVKIRNDFENGDTPREIIDVLNAHVEELLAGKVAEQAISVGQTAPLESTLRFKEQSVPLSYFSGEHYLVVTWFRGNW